MRSLGIQDEQTNELFLPYQPLLIGIANANKKGCSKFYKILSKKSELNNKIHLREAAWHTELQGFLSVDFWQNTYKLTATLKYENKLKWLQSQMQRGCLKTNNTVHHIKPNVSPLCHYCRENNERILHLFFNCPIVNQFWENLQINLLAKMIFIPISRNAILFGIHDEKPNSISNYILLVAKQYIWITKFKSPPTNLSVQGFLNILKSKIRDLIAVFTLLGKHDETDTWNTILISL